MLPVLSIPPWAGGTAAIMVGAVDHGSRPQGSLRGRNAATKKRHTSLPCCSSPLLLYFPHPPATNLLRKCSSCTAWYSPSSLDKASFVFQHFFLKNSTTHCCAVKPPSSDSFRSLFALLPGDPSFRLQMSIFLAGTFTPSHVQFVRFCIDTHFGPSLCRA